jgi:anti-anti-sigma regulatory factor
MTEATRDKEGVSRLDITVTTSDGGHLVTMSGQVDERSSIADYTGMLEGSVILDLEKVSFINSVGVRDWIRTLRELRERGVAVTLRRCSEAIVHQMNMIVEVRAGAEIESFFAPYECEDCGYEASMQLDAREHRELLARREAPVLGCAECGGSMTFSELGERYFLFLE